MVAQGIDALLHQVLRRKSSPGTWEFGVEQRGRRSKGMVRAKRAGFGERRKVGFSLKHSQKGRLEKPDPQPLPMQSNASSGMIDGWTHVEGMSST